MKKTKRLMSYLLAGTMAFTTAASFIPQVAIASESSINNVDEKSLLEIEDQSFRQVIVEKFLGKDRDPIPADAETPPAGYSDPLYGSDLAKIKLIENMELKSWTHPSVKSIKSLKGLEYFTGLKKIDIQNVTLDSIDFRGNKNLEYIRVDKCRIPNGVNVSGLTKLENLQLSDNIYNSIDLSTNTGLKILQSTAPYSEKEKGLTSIDLTNNPLLKEINLTLNPLKEINVKNNKELEEILFTWTDVKTIDLSNLQKLKKVTGISDYLTEVKLNDNPELDYVSLSNTPVAKLDLSNSPKLRVLSIPYSSALKSLNLENYKNIEKIDMGNSAIEKLNVSGAEKLKEINAYKAKLKNVDLSDLTALYSVDFRDNELENIILKNNTALDKIKVQNNKLRKLDVSEAPALRYIECENNMIEELNTAGLKLNNISCANNRIKTLDLKDSNISSLNSAKVSKQETIIAGALTDGKYVVNMADIVGNENVKNIKSVTAGTFDKEAGTVTLDSELSSFEYVYHTATRYNYKNEPFDIDMEVVVRILGVQNIIDIELIKGPDQTEYKSGEKFNPNGIILKVTDRNQLSMEIGPDRFEEFGIKIDKDKLKTSHKEVILSVDGVEKTISIPVKVKSKGGGQVDNPVENPVDKGKSYIDGYEDGTFKPDSSISRAESAKIIAIALKEFDGKKDYTTSFTDVKTDSWYKNYVGFMEELKAIEGFEDGTFKPDEKITRAQFATVIARLNGYKENEIKSSFNDLEGHWAKSYIAFIENKGWINGYGDGTFKPDNEITRAEAVTIVNRVLGLKVDKAEIEKNIDDYTSFTDLTKDHWAYYDILKSTNY